VNSPESVAANSPTSSEPLLAEGLKLAGCYVLQKKIETAGAAVVWLAHDEVLGRDVSLHFLPTPVRNDERAMEEIRKEVKKNRQLIHPHILRVHDLVEEPEFVAISMDSFTGESLAARLKQQRTLTPDAIQPWLGSLCQTLDDAHKVNLTHRDLAPSNLFLTAEGIMLVSGFGISRIVQDALARATRGSNPRLSYLSPQLADGQVPTRSDDVYSLGMLLFELLTGELPFNGGDPHSQIKRIAAPRVSARLAAARKSLDLPASWDETIAAALRKDAAQRPGTTLEIAAKLEKVAVRKTTVDTAQPTVVAAAAEPSTSRQPDAIAPSETPAPSSATPAVAAIAAGALPSDPPPRKAVEMLRERAAELARTKSSSGTPPPSPLAAEQTSPAKSDLAGQPAATSPIRKDAAEIYPDLPRNHSRGPALALAAGIALAAIAGTAYILRDSKSGDAASVEDAGLATTEESYASEIRSVNHKTDLPVPAAPQAPEPATPAPKAEPVVLAKASIPAPVAPAKALAATPVKTTSTAPTPKVAPVTTPVPAAPTPVATPAPVAIAKIAEPAPPAATFQAAPPEEMLLAANRAVARPKTPARTPTAPTADEPVPTQEAVAEKMNAVEKIKQSLQASELSYQELLKQQKSMEEAAAELQKTVDQKVKESLPMRKAMEDLQKIRKQREETAKAAEMDAQKAQQIAAEKARLVEEARKTLADLEAQNQEKQNAQERADSDLAQLRSALTERQQAAATLSKAAAESKTARAVQMATVEQAEQEVERAKLRIAKVMAAETARKAREEADQLVAQKALERSRIETEITAMKKMFEEKMKTLEDAQKAVTAAEAKTKDTDGFQKKAEEEALKLLNQTTLPAAMKSAAPAPAPATPTPVATPAPAAPAPAPPAPTAPPSASVTPAPAAVPQPTPAAPSAANPAPAASPMPAAAALVASDQPLTAIKAGPTAAPALAMKTEPAKTLSPAPETPAPKPAAPPAEGQQENSLGMRFAPVGDIYFSIWQTRMKDFEVFAKAVDLRSNAWKGPGFKQAPDHPVVNVSWHEAVAFCKWLSEKERKDGTLTAGQNYRLPSDLEWSKAVGPPDETGRNPEGRDMGVPDVYPWGNQWPPPASAGNYTGEETGSDVAIKGYDDGFAWTSPVGSFPANKYGLYDMGGNVWQWVMDTWNGESKHKVLRGASWYNGALKLSLLSSCRVHAAPDSSTDNYGFRIVRSAEQGKSAR